MSELNNVPEFKIATWGHFVWNELFIVHPIKMDLKRATEKEGRHIIKNEYFTIEYENNDSRKNLHRVIRFIEVKTPIVIYTYGSLSRTKTFETAYLITPHGDVSELEIKEKMAEREVGSSIVVYRQKYVVFNGNEVVVHEEEIGRKPAPGRTKVVIEVKPGVMKVYGDTYPIKEILKSMNFEWRPNEKVWEHSNDPVLEKQLIEKLQELGVIVEKKW